MGRHPVNDRRGLKSFQISIVRPSLIARSAVFTGDEELSLEFSEVPERVVVQKTASYVDEIIPGRSEPWKNYSHSNATVVSFTAKLVATGGGLNSSFASAGLSIAATAVQSFLAPITANVSFPQAQASTASPLVSAGLSVPGRLTSVSLIPVIMLEVHKRVDWLEALTYPQYDEMGRAFPPPLVHLSHGANFKKRGIIRDVQFTYLPPYEPITLLCMQVECSITFEEVNFTPKGYLDVRNRWDPLKGGLNRFTPNKQDLIGASRSALGL